MTQQQISATLDALRRHYSAVTFDGAEYILTEQAYLDWDPNNGAKWYTARAIDPAKIGADGWADTFRVEWSIINPDAEDEDQCCNWDDPCNASPDNGAVCIDRIYCPNT